MLKSQNSSGATKEVAMNVTTQGIGHKVMSVLMALVLAIGLAPMVPGGKRLGCGLG